ncbi:MAG: sensor domain-containing diguanylate cyclase [Gaiellales bacterium]
MALTLKMTRLERPVVPFLGIAALALAATGLETSATNWELVVAAAVGVAVLAAVAAVLPWSSLPPATVLVLPITIDLVIAMLRQAQGGSTSGYGPLVILPVVWVGLTQGRRAVAAMSCCTTLVFALPLVLIGAPLYPETGWRSVVLWAVVSAVIGIGVNRAVAFQRDLTNASGHRALGLTRLVETQTAIANADVGLTDLMTTAAEGALALTGADGACIEILDGEEIVCIAAAGAAVEFLGLRLKADESITGECFRAREIMTCSDSETDSHAHREACRLVGARSLILAPLLDGNDMLGVLLIWSASPGDFLSYEPQLLELLANIVGGALVRAELIEKLTGQAVTDELTGLANRRAWYHQLDQALARGRRTGQPLSILILDLDGFKQVNDEQGHSAGDVLLKAVGDRWSTELRATDLLGRIGGDEFGVILELTDGTAALEVIGRLERAITGWHRASTGLAVWDGAEDATALIARADADMYAHKRARAAIAA